MPPGIKAINRMWARHFLVIEGLLALLIPASFAFWVEWTRSYGVIANVLSSNRGAVYGTLASVFGALLGFVITTLSIVAGFSGRLVPMRASRYYDQLWSIFMSATWALGVASVVAVGALLLDRESHQLRWVVYVVMWWSLFAMARVFRSVWVLEKVVRFVAHAPPDTTPPPS